MTYLCPPEPAEITWTKTGIVVIPGIRWEWWTGAGTSGGEGMNAVNQAPGPCPCGVPACDAFGTKIAAKTGHLKGCTCLPCQGSANRKNGRAAHKKMHRALGGVGDPPEHEGRAKPYHVMVEVCVLPESKSEGRHVPQSFHDFISGSFLLGAMQQSAREVPIGSGVVPSGVVDGRWLIADLGDGKRGRR